MINKRLALCLLILMICLNAGCWSTSDRLVRKVDVFLPTGNILVLGFRPAITRQSEPVAFKSPVSGSIFMAETVDVNAVNGMTNKLLDMLLDFKDYSMISPEEYDWNISGSMSNRQPEDHIKTYMEMGQAFSADAVLVGYIYRWRERKGGQYSVESPASVAFDLYLISSESGDILWKGMFDKAQTPLSDNILDLKTFVKGRGKWMTSYELANIGMVEIIETLPLKRGSGE